MQLEPAPSRWPRVARGSAVAVFSIFVAAMSHLIAGGHTPSALAVTLSLAFAVPAAVVAVGRKVTIVRLVVAVAMSQVLFHLLFSLSGTGTSVVTGGHHGSIQAVAGAASGHSESLGMWVAHAVAAIVAICALRLAQRTVIELAILRLIRSVTRTLEVVAPTELQRPLPTVTPTSTVEPRQRLESAISRRGPPSQRAALTF